MLFKNRGWAEKTYRLFSICFFILFLVVAILAAGNAALMAHYARWQAAALFLAATGLFAGALGLSRAAALGGRRMAYFGAPLLILAVGLLPRGMLLLNIGGSIAQSSDFGLAFSASRLLPYTDGYFRTFSAWLAQVWYLKAVPSELAGLWLNALYASASAVMLYFTLLLRGRPRGTAVLAALLFLCIPSFVIYTLILSPEFLHLMFFTAAMLLWTLKARAASKGAKLGLAALAGLFLAGADLFRSLGVVYLIAYGIARLVRMGMRRSFKGIFRRALPGLLALMVYLGAGEAAYAAMARAAKEPISRNLVPHYLYVGLTHGVYTKETSLYLDYAKENNYDYQAAGQQLMARWQTERASGKWPLPPSFFVMKLATAWASDDYLFFLHTDRFDSLRPLLQWYLLLLVAAVALSGLTNLKGKGNGLQLFLQVVLVGFTLLMLVSEVQGRYKVAVWPAVCVSAAEALGSVFRKRKGITPLP